MAQVLGRITKFWLLYTMVPLGRLELPHLAPEASALSSELQGHAHNYYTGERSIEQEGLVPQNQRLGAGAV